MALLKQAVKIHVKLEQFFEKLREGQAPDKFTRTFLADLGFKSSNWVAAIGLLKGLGFLSPEGSPTVKYMDFLDKTKWGKILAEAVKDAYSDIFTIKRDPTDSDVGIIAGKYKSTYNMPEKQADLCAHTFLALLRLCDKDVLLSKQPDRSSESLQDSEEIQKSQQEPTEVSQSERRVTANPVSLNYNIQIHLPATKDMEVYNAIFKSLRDHIID